MIRQNSYDHRFFEELGPEAETSAKVVVPPVCDIMAPASVIDLGCGAGSWLAEFVRRGVHDYLGGDGEYVPAELLQIPSDRFLARDLRQFIELGDTLVQSPTTGTLSLRQLLSALPAALVRAIQRRIPKAVRPTRGG